MSIGPINDGGQHQTGATTQHNGRPSLLVMAIVIFLSSLVGGMFGTTFGLAWSAMTGRETYRIELRGFVPVVCTASRNTTAVSYIAGETQIGDVAEFCNNPNGFQVWADYPTTLNGATLTLDGKRVALPPGGSALVDSSDTPVIAKKTLTIESTTAGEGYLAFRVACPRGGC